MEEKIFKNKAKDETNTETQAVKESVFSLREMGNTFWAWGLGQNSRKEGNPIR